MTSNHRGLRLVEGLSARELGDEIVVVDQTTQQAHALRGATAELWRALDAGRAPALPGSEVDAAKRELAALGLVEADGITRRDMLRRTGTVAVAGTVISIALPEVMAAASAGHWTATTLTTAQGSSTGSIKLTANVTTDPSNKTFAFTASVNFYEVVGSSSNSV